MYARVTLLEIDAVRADVDEVLERYRREVAPQIRNQRGYGGMFVLANEEGQGMVITLWTDEASLDASMPLASEAVERFLTVLRAAPGRERYEVRIADVPAFAVE